MLLLSMVDLFFIQKALRKHPDYDSSFVKEKEVERYCASLSEEELEKFKIEEKKQNTKDFLKRIFLLSTGTKTDLYKVVRLFLILTLLLELKKFVL
jgi:hypothetical protein